MLLRSILNTFLCCFTIANFFSILKHSLNMYIVLFLEWNTCVHVSHRLQGTSVLLDAESHTHAHTHALTHALMHARTHTHALMHSLTHSCTHARTHIHPYTRTHAHTRTRTHARNYLKLATTTTTTAIHIGFVYIVVCVLSACAFGVYSNHGKCMLII